MTDVVEQFLMVWFSDLKWPSKKIRKLYKPLLSLKFRQSRRKVTLLLSMIFPHIFIYM